ncbi:MAG TPA: hypothetical protein VIS74_06440 [Chthoniobacterales bacterium]
MKRLLPFLLTLAAVDFLGADDKPLFREPGFVYLADFGQKPLRVPLNNGPANAYFDLALTRYAGTLRYPQEVEVLGFGDRLYRIRGRAQQGQILAYVPPDSLAPVDPEFIANLRKAEERRKLVEALIAKNEAALGMTLEEVRLSLGKPQKKSQKANAEGVEQVWEFVTYTLIPQTTTVIGPGGVQTLATTYIKTPKGKMEVHFKNGIVSELNQSEGTVLTGNETTIVAPPIFVY